MVDQNIALILSALLGGLLTIIGGFTANYFNQSLSNRSEKRKELRNTLEEIFKETNHVSSSNINTLSGSFRDRISADGSFDSSSINNEKVDEINHIDTINMLVRLYVPPLISHFEKYNAEQRQYREKVIAIINKTHITEEEILEIVNFIQNVNSEFQNSIIDLAKKKGYSYF